MLGGCCVRFWPFLNRYVCFLFVILCFCASVVRSPPCVLAGAACVTVSFFPLSVAAFGFIMFDFDLGFVDLRERI